MAAAVMASSAAGANPVGSAGLMMAAGAIPLVIGELLSHAWSLGPTYWQLARFYQSFAILMAGLTLYSGDTSLPVRAVEWSGFIAGVAVAVEMVADIVKKSGVAEL